MTQKVLQKPEPAQRACYENVHYKYFWSKSQQYLNANIYQDYRKMVTVDS